MSDSDAGIGHGHELTVDPADNIEALLRAAHQALRDLDDAVTDVTCPNYDPTGERTARVAADLADRWNTDLVDADVLLAHTANVRDTLRDLLAMPAGRHDGDSQ